MHLHFCLSISSMEGPLPVLRACQDEFSWLLHHVTMERKLCRPLPDEHGYGKPDFFLIHHRMSSQ